MSVIGDIIDDIADEIGTAIPGATVVQGFVSKVKTEQLPHVQIYNPAMEVVEVLDLFRQEKQHISVLVLVTARDTTQAVLTGYVDSVVTQLRTNPHLTTQKVDWVYVTSMAVSMHADTATKFLSAIFEVVAELTD